MQLKKMFFGQLIVGLLVLGACAAPIETAVPTSSAATSTLRAFPTETPTRTPYPTDYMTPSLTPSITPTATLVLYSVTADDDMFGIALRYGISLDALKAANPTVEPNMMSIGTVLVIPITPTPGPQTQNESQSETAVVETANPDENLHPDCYRDGIGGVWCFLLIANKTDKALENVSARISLKGTSSEFLQETIAIMPLNVLPAGQALPVVAYFSSPTPKEFSSEAILEESLPKLENDNRYLSARITEQVVSMADDGLSVHIRGDVELDSTDKPLSSVWVLAVGFDEQGRVVGVRRWDYEPTNWQGEAIPFELNLYSMQGNISRLETFVEVRPVLP